MTIDELARQHETAHPGYLLADWYTAALPSYEVYLRVQMQVEQPLPAIEQFALRAMEAGVKTASEIGGVLGLEYAIVCDGLERLQRMGFVAIARPNRDGGRQEILSITSKGRTVLQTLLVLRPEEESFPVCLDALTGEYFAHRRLYRAGTVRDADWHQVAPYLVTPTYDEIDRISLQRVWREVRRTVPKAERNKELLDVLKVEKAFLGYRPMRVLQFIRRADGALLLHVYDGVERSPRHEAALMKMEDEGIRALRADPKRGPEQVPDPIAELIGAELYEAAKRKAAEVPRLQRDIEELKRQIEESEELKRTSQIPEEETQAEQQQGELRAEIERLSEYIQELSSAAPTVQILSMVEHRPKLLQALRDAKEEVIIVSPWLSPTAVNRELRDLITQRAADGVKIWIGYGFGEPDYREERTLRDLERIQQGKGGRNLHLCRLEDTHAKVVICDAEYMITTSFNWLSFAGREDWGNRVEFGTLTTDPTAIQAMLDRLMPLFAASSTQPSQATA